MAGVGDRPQLAGKPARATDFIFNADELIGTRARCKANHREVHASAIDLAGIRAQRRLLLERQHKRFEHSRGFCCQAFVGLQCAGFVRGVEIGQQAYCNRSTGFDTRRPDEQGGNRRSAGILG
ncbi:hypothetical protein D3C80_670500 [compost metagenome]